ncbi:MAG: DUF4230 domain-containing protein [Chloroflexi bacterium]|nr:DUF4230 domain-containing protein [Chloroflexota bacterium]
MRKLRQLTTLVLALPMVALILLFVIAAAVNGVGEAVELTLSAPRNLFCSIVPFCDVGDGDETEIVDSEQIWTRIHERSVLDTGKYETRQSWKAERTTWPVTHSMRMRATVHITMGVNLDNISREDIIVDDENESVTIVMPRAQPVECFLTEIEYYDESCLLVCDELEQDLQRKALERVQDSDEVAAEINLAYERAEADLAVLLTPFVEDYDLVFQQDTETPPRVEGSSCD